MPHHDHDPFAELDEHARAALASHGIHSLEDAAAVPRDEFLELHGVPHNTLARILALIEGNEGETGDRDPNEPE
ncbi:MAG: hypothetical protein GX427_08825 [Actinomycetales bacterium]|jgi:hypothetical protein|nr:hypothetical protein [Actinomycetales bacterium]